MEPSYALQVAIRERLLASPELLALVPADFILSRHARPEGDAMVIIGTGNTLYADDYRSFADQAYLDVHVWTKEPDFRQSKAIAHLVREALRHTPWSAGPSYMVHGASITARFLRDPDGEFSHAVVGVSATMMRQAA
ncbi:MAG: hypothetical protein K0S56_1605 [Microvirga sp.]|jgi:hypothetical protein|nr:hypothetical protein [Microvirga sp.]